MRPRWLFLVLAPIAVAICAAPGCGNASAPSPFSTDAGTDAANDASDGGGGSGGGVTLSGSGGGDAGADGGPVLGGPCLDDGQCTDGSSCTFNACDKALGRCRYTPDDSKCQDGIYCNGMEVCDVNLGCVAVAVRVLDSVLARLRGLDTGAGGARVVDRAPPAPVSRPRSRASTLSRTRTATATATGTATAATTATTTTRT